MAVNCSRRTMFPAHTAEVVNGFLVEGKCEGFGRPKREIEDCIDYMRDGNGIDGCSSRDIIDLLPSDPFGMDISTNFTAAISGWLHDLEDYGGRGMMKKNMNVGKCSEDYGFFSGLSVIWNSGMGNVPANWKLKTVGEVNRFTEKSDVSCGSAYNEGNISIVDFKDVGSSAEVTSAGDDGSPHQALFFALGYLKVKDLLSVGSVCKSLCCAVRSDSLLWRNIHIEQPLNERITDEILLQLTSRAQGHLQCLSLVQCPRITDCGLRRVLENNPRLNKLCVPGCTRLSIEGIVTILKAFNVDRGSQGIRYLRIGGLYGITHEHFKDLRLLLGADEHPKEKSRKPHFFLRGKFYVLCDDDRAMDVEVCPRCEKLRLVYDCPSEACQVKDQNTPLCRACAFCIPRCAQCGRCINDSEYEETFCLDNICSDCFQHLPKS